MIVYAPFTSEQVESLNAYQSSGAFHPYTCDCGRVLRAVPAGLECPWCRRVQAWAHEFTVNGEWRGAGEERP